MINNIRPEMPMPTPELILGNPTPTPPLNPIRKHIQIGISIVIFLSVVSLLYSRNKSQQIIPDQVHENTEQTSAVSELPAINKKQSTPSIVLAIKSTLQAEELNTFQVGKKSTAYITIKSTDLEQFADGAELSLRFDPSVLAGVSVLPNKLFSTVIRNTVSQDLGNIDIALIRQPDEEVVISDEVVLATLSFTPMLKGSTFLSFENDKTIVAGNQGDNILESTTSLTIESE
ncbi:MAG: hypothetical protein COY80_00525 [Candidatus Pacebacteria bacterium CG_4_10_14_0_8_um_filter_42_14]|nr:MAG: hypothetical protein COY80_00525 [Candidatus Pacebacteria bacterium CG_4_10_14_0_8_um_filter_42_14]